MRRCNMGYRGGDCARRAGGFIREMAGFTLTRRAFLAATTTTAVSLSAGAQPNTARVVPRKVSPNEKLNVAAIGCGGKGFGDMMSCAETETIVALCDVDWKRCAEAFYRQPEAKVYRDYRTMLEEMAGIDAVIVATPDHSHAGPAYMAMGMGKHVYVQKPLAHTVAEARLLTRVAAETGVVTQMGNQGHSGDGVRQLCEMIASGAIGQVREAHVWTSRPTWENQGRAERLAPAAAHEELDWDRWLGPAPWRPFNTGYAPFNWRAWQDFGAGALGDMACHLLDPVYMSLNLVDAANYTVEAVDVRDRNDETFPTWTTIKYTFPARGAMAPVTVYWYDGHYPNPNEDGNIFNRPERPRGVPEKEELGDKNRNGSILIGDGGIITAGEYGGTPRLLPAKRMADYRMPEPVMTRVPDENHYQDWLQAIKNGRKACSDFSYAGPFTEMVNFGNLVVKSGRKLHWDNLHGAVTNVPNGSDLVSKEYRKGWELPC